LCTIEICEQYEVILIYILVRSAGDGLSFVTRDSSLAAPPSPFFIFLFAFFIAALGGSLLSWAAKPPFFIPSPGGLLSQSWDELSQYGTILECVAQGMKNGKRLACQRFPCVEGVERLARKGVGMTVAS